MKINNIQIFTPNYINKKHQTNPQKQEPENYKEKIGKLPSTAQYLAFTGGYSLDLAQTVKHLDKLAEKNSQIYPQNIRVWLEMALEEGNKAKETLIDIHKKYFASLKKCTSLSEIKEKFPEFKDVISSENIFPNKGSFIDKYKNGEIEIFDKNEDLSVQLIKLYWGEGFSLNDLKRYADGVDLYYAMKNLRIPTASRDYGHILKMSDPEYNERLTAQMTYQRRLTLDKKAQEMGEPLYIPRGPQTEEHKLHISEGLIRYWQENPDRIFSMSERTKSFYKENPEKLEELSRVLKKAWSTFGADKIKKALSEFMKKHGHSSFNAEENPVNITKSQSNVLKKFWDTNEWAKKTFSKNMQYAWKKVKQENETFYYARTMPLKLIKFIENQANLEPGILNADTKFNPYLKTSFVDEESNNIVKKYIEQIEGIENIMADTYQISVFNIVKDLKGMKPSGKDKKAYNDLLSLATLTVQKNATKNGYKVQYTEEAQQDFLNLAVYAVESKNQKLIDIVYKALDDGYDTAVSFHKMLK